MLWRRHESAEFVVEGTELLWRQCPELPLLRGDGQPGRDCVGTSGGKQLATLSTDVVDKATEPHVTSIGVG